MAHPAVAATASEPVRVVNDTRDRQQLVHAVVVGEYERAFYGSQYALMAPLFEHYGVQLWMPEAGCELGAGGCLRAGGDLVPVFGSGHFGEGQGFQFGG